MIAYFSMEIAIDPDVPTYAGGLGVLAGDMVRAAADCGAPFLAVTLLSRKGYFRQRLDLAGRQREESNEWAPERTLELLPERVSIRIGGRSVAVAAWRRCVRGMDGAVVPVLLLDTDVDENAVGDRSLTHFLYGGDADYRLAQEAVLGIGGIRMLRALGYTRIRRFHMNEGHSALLVMELLDEHLRTQGRIDVTDEDVAAVRGLCVFTTHTPVSAANDVFEPALAARVMDPALIDQLNHRYFVDGQLNMTSLALAFSHYVNGVAMRHGEVSRRIFQGYEIDAITNGVHAATWVSPPFAALFDRRIPLWRRDNFSLRYAISIPDVEVREAHARAKLRLLELVNQSQTTSFDPSVLTLGFGRRATAYKRAELIISDLERLRTVAAAAGRIQLVFAGKAHPRDEYGKRVIERIFQARDVLRNEIAIAYLEDYDVTKAAILTAGSDVWLNTPQPPLEASGTSGMKAALNGVPSLSVLDGWWLEGHVEGATGWSIGSEGSLDQPVDTAADAAGLYDKLERMVIPLYYRRPGEFAGVMRHAIALNGSFFNAQRMFLEYMTKAYNNGRTTENSPLASTAESISAGA